MDTLSTEQDLRREAIRRRLAGEPRCDICRDLKHSPRWFSKWWAAYQRNLRTDFADRSRVPLTAPSEIPEAIAQAIVSIRKTLEAATTPAMRYGLIGPRAIQGQLVD
jgi:transposase-like protein